MSIEAMKLALDALESRCGTNADERLAGGAIPALRTAIQQAEAQQPTEQDEQEADGLPPIVAGAIFDFAGFMTTRSEVIEVGSTADAGPVANLVKEWAESRGLDLANAAVLSWQLHITRASLSATGEPVKVAPYNPTEEMRLAMKRIDPALSSEQCRALWSAAWSVAPSTHPAPSEPVMDVRCEGCGYMTHHREHMGCVRAAKQNKPHNLLYDLIEKAILSGHFGVLPMKATIPMCKAGWGASGGELTFQQIGHIYEEMYKARPLPDDADKERR